MDWTKFSTHGESKNRAFEVMCNLLFESWCKKKYNKDLVKFVFVNGSGGDGGVESFGVLADGNIVAVQSKWFPNKIQDAEIRQISDSFATAIRVRPNISKYIVCIPRDLGSKRLVSGGKIAGNTEADRWNEYVSKCNQSNQNVDIILWDETTLQEQLTQPEAQGIQKYWFENSVIFDDSFRVSFEKAANSWAKLKYIPELYTRGYIHRELERFLGSVELTKWRYDKLCEVIFQLEALYRAYNDLLKLGIPEKKLEHKIQNDLPVISQWLRILEDNKVIVKNGGKAYFINDDLNLSCDGYDIRESSLHSRKYFHAKEAEEVREAVRRDFYDLKYILKIKESNKIVFLGMQGTGKTAGVIAEASFFLQNKVHLPVIIHAKEFAEGETWGSMIIKSLGLNTNWNEMELFNALQNAAFLFAQINKQGYYYEPKCVIFVDGIDESSSWTFWKNKIDETKAFQNAFPRVKFVFLSRPYVFDDRSMLSYNNSIYELATTGDGDLEEICNRYFKEYKIDIGGNEWIKKNLKSPVAVKLFCDIYRNQKIETLPLNTTVLTVLCKAKIASLEKAFKNDHNHLRGHSLIETALIELAELFARNKFIQYQEIHDEVFDLLKGSLIDILNFLVSEGVIYTFTKQTDDFSTPETFYSWGIQPAFDYLIAQKIFRELSAGKSIEIETISGVYQMLSLIVIENGKLITEYQNVIIEDQAAFELICFAMANCSTEIAGKYNDFLKNLMRLSAKKFSDIFRNVMSMTIGVENHPLGSLLLNDFLNYFEKSAERDVWWSLPRGSYNLEGSEFFTDIELEIERFKLNKTDKAFAAPLTLVWSLSSLNNIVRQHSRDKLTKWGITQPLEFWKLFKKCVSINDMQILEDLFAIAYGIALSQFECKEYLIIASNWFIDKFFSNEGLIRFENVVLRYYGAGIVKIAISLKVLDRKYCELVTPPYNYEPNILPLHKGALNADRMDGYEAIYYDLARYVLCDYLDGFFPMDYNTMAYPEEARKFLEKYKKKYNLSEVKIDGFIISMAYQYLLNQGWCTEKFWLMEDKKKPGIDNAILGAYHPATHGEMSHVMTVAEKNVWLAKHHIEAVLANELPYQVDYNTYEYVTDYSQLEYFINTFQDYSNAIRRVQNHQWFNTDSMASLDFETIDKDKIENWIQEEYVPSFERWLSEHNGHVLINSFTGVQNNMSGVSETVWVSSGAVKVDDFSDFLRVMDNYFEGRDEMLNVLGFNANHSCRLYCTPQEACLVHPEREINSYIIIPYSDRELKVFKLTEACTSSDEEETERSFSFPSKFLRELTGIINGDGFSYLNNRGQCIASYSDAGESWGTSQKTLMIKSDLLSNGLDLQGYQLFWLFRDYRKPSAKAWERYETLTKGSDRTFLVWKEGTDFNYKELFPVKPEKKVYEESVNTNFETLLRKYGISD